MSTKRAAGLCSSAKALVLGLALATVPISALAQESDVARGYELGASKYLRKPFRPSELIAIARELAAQPGGE